MSLYILVNYDNNTKKKKLRRLTVSIENEDKEDIVIIFTEPSRQVM